MLGASINYVSRRWGVGISRISQILMQLHKQMNLLAEGGGAGGQEWQNLAYVVYGCPLTKIHRLYRYDTIKYRNFVINY